MTIHLDLRHNVIVRRAIDEEHHLADIAREGYAPTTIPIVLAATFVGLLAVVGVVLGVAIAVYYWV